MQQQPVPSKKPYLLRAIYEWCTDNGYTPHVAVHLDARTCVPRHFMRHREVVLNISFEATHQLQMGNEWIEFNARFASKPYKVKIPVDNVLAIYAYENGQGMAFQLDNTDDTDNALMLKEEEGDDKSPQSHATDLAAADEQDEQTIQSPQANENEQDHSSQPPRSKKGSRSHLKLIK